MYQVMLSWTTQCSSISDQCLWRFAWRALSNGVLVETPYQRREIRVSTRFPSSPRRTAPLIDVRSGENLLVFVLTWQRLPNCTRTWCKSVLDERCCRWQTTYAFGGCNTIMDRLLPFNRWKRYLEEPNPPTRTIACTCQQISRWQDFVIPSHVVGHRQSSQAAPELILRLLTLLAQISLQSQHWVEIRKAKHSN